MSPTLKARLRQINSIRSSRTLQQEKPAGNKDIPASWPGWVEAGYMTLKRELTRNLPVPFPSGFHEALSIVIPDFAYIKIHGSGRLPVPEDLLFFDLETTGLSGGAGTIAFLAAFGRLSPSGEKNTRGSCRLTVTQYLLLDYPGECDFTGKLVEELSGNSAPVLVTYNGKSFDSQILHNRCLMNRIKIPEYYHADLLHPARRLWKKILPNCSQSTIEVSVLGLDRTGDISGALAPDIWFSFLRSGEKSDLLSVCEHNEKDIYGLARLFFAMAEIAANPSGCGAGLIFDEESLALFWERAVRKNPCIYDERELTMAETLLKKAAEKGFPRAAFSLALNYFRNGRFQEGRTILAGIAEGAEDAEGDAVNAGRVRAAAYKSLAIDAEWRLGDASLALAYTRKALELPGLSDSYLSELEVRYSRLEGKVRNE